MLVSVPLFGLAVTAQLIIALLLVAGSTLQCAAPGAARLPTRLLTVTTRSPPSTIDHYLLLSRRLNALHTAAFPPAQVQHAEGLRGAIRPGRGAGPGRGRQAKVM